MTVKWRDSRLYITQEAGDSEWEACTIISTGFVIEENESVLVLAGDLVDGGDVRRVIVIPKENIILPL